MYIGFNVKSPLFLSDLDETWIFSTDFSYIKFHENPPVGAELFHADGRAVRHGEANSRSSTFYERA